MLLFVGRINKIKNLEFLIDSLNELDKLGEKFRMLFVGSGGDMDDLKSKVKKLGLENKIIFTGRASDEELIYAYVRSKLFLFPSLYDASSLVQIEAASQKTPTVFIRGAVTSATVTENVNGYMADNDTVLYAKKVQEILRDAETYNRISQNAYNDLYITWDKTVLRMYQKYLSIIDKYKDELFEAELQEKKRLQRKQLIKETKINLKKQKQEEEKQQKLKEKLKKQKEKLIGESKKQKKEKLQKEKQIEKLALKKEKLRLRQQKLLKAEEKLFGKKKKLS
ncbi:MAG: glycosyltransferase [Clostridia bacterium]|nr:glycosyltransferase [Clostridia bacterium]